MWKEKLYTGVLTNTATDATTITRLPSSSTMSVNKYRTDLINQIFVSFLEECGCEDVVYYPIQNSSDSRRGNLFIYGTPFQLFVTGTNAYWGMYQGSLNMYAGSTSYSVIFSGSNYSIRCILAGNPKGSFNFAIGSTGYGSTGYNSNFFIFKGKNIVTDDTICLYGPATGQYLYMVNGESYLQFAVHQYCNVVQQLMDITPNKFPLIPKLHGCIKIEDGYEMVSQVALGVSGNYLTPLTAYFVKIGTHIYLCTGIYLNTLVDCGPE